MEEMNCIIGMFLLVLVLAIPVTVALANRRHRQSGDRYLKNRDGRGREL